MSYIAYANVAMSLYSMMNRKADPSGELLVSITRMLSAINLKLDGIFDGIEALHDELQNVKSEVLATPLRTISTGNRVKIESVSASIDDILATKEFYDQLDRYYSQIFIKYEELEREVNLHATLCEQSEFDDIITLLLEYDRLLKLGYELMSYEAFENGFEFPIAFSLQNIARIKRIAKASLENKEYGLNGIHAKLKKQLDDFMLSGGYKYQGSDKSVHLPTLLSKEDSFVGATVAYRPGKCLEMDPYRKYCLEPGDPVAYLRSATITLNKTPNDLLDDGFPYENLPLLNSVEVKNAEATSGAYLITGGRIGREINMKKDEYNHLVSQYMTVLLTKIFIEHSLEGVEKMEQEIKEVLF